jgi:hypothetical protein
MFLIFKLVKNEIKKFLKAARGGKKKHYIQNKIGIMADILSKTM